jgi:type 2 lantibiotic biosynthesis protein LanM
MSTSQFSARWIRNCDFLFERLADLANPASPKSDQSEFESWRELFDSGTEKLFAQRLASIGLAEDQAKGLFGRPGSGSKIPPWYELLEKASQYQPAEEIFLHNFPFAPLWWPFAAYAKEQVFQPLENRSLMSSKATESLANQLLQDICKLAAEATYRLFAKERAEGVSFEDFVRTTRSSRYENLFECFPALARAVAILVSHWIQTTAIFLARLRYDLSDIRELLGSANLEFPVQSIKAGLSDRHEGGFQAAILEFSPGARIVYKPKDMSLEAALPGVNKWLEAAGSPLRLRFPRSVVKESYGWAEFINQSPCHSAAEVQRYWYQAGVLLCFAYVLNTRDLLVDNLVACGPDPVPIDLEAFFQSEMQSVNNYGKVPESGLPEHRRKSSVIDVGLLPIWLISGIDAVCDLSGLSGNKELVAGLSRVGWQDVNSDRMQPIQEAITAEAAQNKVFFNGQEQRIEEHWQEIVRGFSDLHGLIVSRKQSFLEFLSSLSSARSRVIFRSTSVYSKLIKESTHPDALRSGIRRSLVFERLFRPLLKGQGLSAYTKKLLNFEVERLSLLDIPRIYAGLHETNIHLENRDSVPNALWEPPVTTVVRRAEALSSADLPYHLENIGVAVTRKPKPEKLPLSEERRLDLAIACADSILSQTDNHSDDFIWRLPSYCVGEPIPTINRIGLYTGDLGVLIFLAGVHQLHKLPQLPSMLDRYLASWNGAPPEDETALGICNGAGSLIYGCVLLSKLTGDKRWLTFSEQVAHSIRESAIHECQEPDITSGLAGFLVALVALYEATQEQSWLAIGQICAETLRERFTPGLGWVRPNGDRPLGLAHGTAGIALAGIRYARASGKEIGIALADSAFSVDRGFYSHREHNWPVLANQGSSFMTTWCAGRPGILLARAYAWQLSRDARLLTEVQDGLKHFRTSPMGTDHWCCGSLGNAEILRSLAAIIGQPEFAERSVELIGKVIHRASQCTFYRFSPSLGENYCFQPSLFRGYAGVGYTLLRSLRPLQFPSITGFEIQ